MVATFPNARRIAYFVAMPPVLLIRKSICRRHDLTEGLKKLKCKTLIFVGESSEFHEESVYMSAKMGRKSCALVEVECSSLF